jgi:hypothetical protein
MKKDIDWFGMSANVMKAGLGIAVIGAAFEFFKK